MTSARGARKWVQMIGLPVREAGQVVRVEGAIQDISIRREAERAAHQREALLDTVFQVLPDIFFLMDADGTIRDYRASRAGDLYLPPEHFLGKRIQEVLPPAVATVFRDNLARVAREGHLISFEYPLYVASGDRYYEARLSQLPETTQLILVVRDISERRRIEDEVRRLNAELEERVAVRTAELAAINKELETFTYSVSHDLKAPLRGIDGYSRLLLEDHRDQLDEEGRLFLRNVRQGVDQMSRLIADLLAYSRMERHSLRGIPVELGALMGRILVERATDIQASGARVRHEVTGLVARADPEGLGLVLRNLLDNALKFHRPDAPPEVAVRGQASGDILQLVFQDQGIGFDMRFHDRIFEIFQRLQRAEDFPGTGIGLAIVHKAMHRMGGRIWAESTPGQGATFFLELPR
ncbi:MAG: PAS domain-containing protein [Chromatiaceae bacterium]|nr:PAS domain-containing protein [Chromatiaceae bacterium]MBP8288626.1 PAS domain-containing protein [Chromatiaceae bacterium]